MYCGNKSHIKRPNNDDDDDDNNNSNNNNNNNTKQQAPWRNSSRNSPHFKERNGSLTSLPLQILEDPL